MVVLSLYGLVLLFATWASYSLTDPNLILVNSVGFVEWQNWMWQTFFVPPHRVAWLYGGIITVLWVSFALLFARFGQWKKHFRSWEAWLLALFVVGILTLSYNWLSHDVFNYIFNAKMLTVYGLDPHEHTALEFAYDPWTRFMHNTHTPAPYGHGWTYLSVIPFYVGFQKFLLTWWIFRIFSMAGVFLTGLAILAWGREEKMSGVGAKVALLGLSPFVLVEFVQNSHNDGWMMAGAVCAVWWTRRFSKGKSILWVLAGLIVWGASIYIKLASIALAPLLLVLLASRWQPKLRAWLSLENIAVASSVLLFLPLFTSQSKWFLPWYLLWSMSWLPLIKNKGWWSTLFGFAVAGSYRYIPWLWTGTYDNGETTAVWITWVGGIFMATVIWLVQARMYNGRG